MIEPLLTPAVWLQASATTRLKLAKDFGLHRSGGPIVTTELGKTHVESDGYSVTDLKGMTVEKMQKYVKNKEVNDLVELFKLCVVKVEAKE